MISAEFCRLAVLNMGFLERDSKKQAGWSSFACRIAWGVYFHFVYFHGRVSLAMTSSLFRRTLRYITYDRRTSHPSLPGCGKWTLVIKDGTGSVHFNSFGTTDPVVTQICNREPSSFTKIYKDSSAWTEYIRAITLQQQCEAKLCPGTNCHQRILQDDPQAGYCRSRSRRWHL